VTMVANKLVNRATESSWSPRVVFSPIAGQLLKLR
jgi:hypothetical protein